VGVQSAQPLHLGSFANEPSGSCCFVEICVFIEQVQVGSAANLGTYMSFSLVFCVR
jgi:hypothetical protein